MVRTIFVPIAPGELLDKLSILDIKIERMTDPAKIANVRAEAELLRHVREEAIGLSAAIDELYRRLKTVNETLWDIEDDIREEERAKRFDERFVSLARSVYRTNDERAAIKRDINLLLGSALIEEKSYASYV